MKKSASKKGKARLKLIKGKMPIIIMPKEAGVLTPEMVKKIAEL